VIDPAEQRWMANRAGSTRVEFDDASHAGGYTHYANIGPRNAVVVIDGYGTVRHRIKSTITTTWPWQPV